MDNEYINIILDKFKGETRVRKIHFKILKKKIILKLPFKSLTFQFRSVKEKKNVFNFMFLWVSISLIYFVIVYLISFRSKFV